jgi:hypothetical protein
MDTRFDRNCQGLARREFLRIGALGFGGALTLPNLLAANAQAAGGKSLLRGKSVVLLFLQGGPPHIETFDPKMTAPAEFRSITGELSTSLPGVTFGGTFPKLGQLAHKLAVVRSYASENSGHTYNEVLSARNPLKATISSMYARVAGTNHPRSGMPLNVLLVPEAIDSKVSMGNNFETGALPGLTDPGTLGPNLRAFNPSGGGELKENMELRLPQERFADRRSLLNSLDTLRRQLEVAGRFEEADKYRQQAFEVITGGVVDAFDLSKEDPRTIARYDTSHLFNIKDVQRWFDMRRASNLLGKQMLLARRLCEAGCGFVTVSDCGWDMHSNGNSPKNLAGMHWLGSQVDHAVSAFVEDLEERGLSDKVLLVVTGEMGRGPRINNNGGRDHYGNLTPLVFAGGGLKMGQVIGQSDSKATEPATERYTPRNLLATIMHVLFDSAELRVARNVPSEIVRVATEESPINELF